MRAEEYCVLRSAVSLEALCAEESCVLGALCPKEYCVLRNTVSQEALCPKE